MKLRIVIIAILAGGLVLLAGCGTTKTNQLAMEAYGEALVTQRSAVEQHSNACATAAAACVEDMCRVAVMLACGANAPQMRIEQPRLRSGGEEFARAFSPVAGLLNTGLQVFGAGYLIDRSGKNATDLVGAVGSVVGQVQGPIDNSIAIGGDQIGGDRVDDRSVGGDRIGGDNRVGDDIGGDQIGGDNRVGDDIGGDQIGGDNRVGDDTRDSCIGDQCRNVSDGPIDQSDNSDNSNNPPPDPVGDG